VASGSVGRVSGRVDDGKEASVAGETRQRQSGPRSVGQLVARSDGGREDGRCFAT